MSIKPGILTIILSSETYSYDHVFAGSHQQQIMEEYLTSSFRHNLLEIWQSGLDARKISARVAAMGITGDKNADKEVDIITIL
jgi:hypothetical protein